MAYMIRRSPYWRNQYNLERAMNQFLDMESEPLPSGFPLDVIESDTEFVVKASVAGFDPKKIEITYDDNTLSIKGEVNEESADAEERKYHIRERSYGSFYPVKKAVHCYVGHRRPTCRREIFKSRNNKSIE